MNGDRNLPVWNRKVRPSPDVLMSEVDGEAVMLDLHGERYFGLNAVGTVIWNFLTTSPTVEEAVKAVCRRFDAPETTIRQDIEILTRELVDNGLLRFVDGPLATLPEPSGT